MIDVFTPEHIRLLEVYAPSTVLPKRVRKLEHYSDDWWAHVYAGNDLISRGLLQERNSVGETKGITKLGTMFLDFVRSPLNKVKQ